MNAYCLIASMPNPSPEKRDAGLRAPRHARMFDGRRCFID